MTNLSLFEINEHDVDTDLPLTLHLSYAAPVLFDHTRKVNEFFHEKSLESRGLLTFLPVLHGLSSDHPCSD